MIVGVLVELSNRNIDKTFDYLVPSSLVNKIKIGIRVAVPFNNQMLEGFVVEIKNSTESEYELKEIESVVDEDIILNAELLELGKYISDTTLSTLISSYQVMLPKALKASVKTNVSKKVEVFVELNVSINDIEFDKLSFKAIDAINYLSANKNVKLSYLRKMFSCTNKLLDSGIIKKVDIEKYRLLDEKIELKEKYPLTFDQREVVNKVLADINQNIVYLLHGVTGSGKTEVHMELIENVIENGKNAIVLVPEISLTPQTVARFRERFGKIIAILHSGLSDGEKYDEWRKIARGEVNIVIGARSAIFAPLVNIGIIIIDEEHTTSYKQDNMPRYSSIDIAKKRSLTHSCPLVLGSATPSLESYARAKKGVYQLLELKNRINNKKLPEVEVVDMALQFKKGNSFFSTRLIEEIHNTLEHGQQVMLLLNRRGYSTCITCKNCGYVEKCPNCDITLTYHKSNNMLRCHYCGYATNVKPTCPSCHLDGLTSYGSGTEKVEEELNRLFPNYQVVRMDFDTTSRKGAHEKIISDFKNNKYQILVGTQMIAKGLDFSNVTLVGVINADTALNIPDFRSSEYTFQLLSQVAGRSGRGDKEGKVIIQTFNKEHYAIKFAAIHDYVGFYNYEMLIRKKLKYPPFFYLTNIKIMSKKYDKAMEISEKVALLLKRELTVSIILGPSACNVLKINNIYRINIIIKYKYEERLMNTLKDLLEHYKSNSQIRIDIDFNPNYM